MNRIKSVVLLAFFGLMSGPAQAQNVNGISWAANFPVVTNPAAGQAKGKVDVQGGYTVKQGWTLASVAIQFIPDPAPNGAQVQAVQCDFNAVVGKQWGKNLRANPLGGPIIGITSMDIPLAPGKYQLWAIGAFEQNPPQGGWPNNVVPPNAIMYVMTNVKNIEIKAPPKPKNEDPVAPVTPVPPS